VRVVIEVRELRFLGSDTLNTLQRSESADRLPTGKIRCRYYPYRGAIAMRWLKRKRFSAAEVRRT
jgi:hypothetical protein